MTWFAIKGPDGVTLCVDFNVSRAWARVGWCGDERVDEAVRLGYRCVEVQLVEINTAPTGGAESKEGKA